MKIVFLCALTYKNVNIYEKMAATGVFITYIAIEYIAKIEFFQIS